MVYCVSCLCFQGYPKSNVAAQVAISAFLYVLTLFGVYYCCCRDRLFPDDSLLVGFVKCCCVTTCLLFLCLSSQNAGHHQPQPHPPRPPPPSLSSWLIAPLYDPVVVRSRVLITSSTFPEFFNCMCYNT